MPTAASARAPMNACTPSSAVRMPQAGCHICTTSFQHAHSGSHASIESESHLLVKARKGEADFLVELPAAVGRHDHDIRRPKRILCWQEYASVVNAILELA